ncbi:unnamed protein product [Spodoptera littoralis]|uniref:SAM domain-containing protein n=1 Tax=Spodoptera littoralis TaxID=7109 RepID=A0A9P0N9R7_SPOLI|nr:unnamed protein product [Spodoptera littoralis]CAH1647576.1 unnamed protein product [Spodoptera littoralis]
MEDSEVMDLLRAWGLPVLGPLFAKNEINMESLSTLTTDDIKEIIRNWGPEPYSFAVGKLGQRISQMLIKVQQDLPVIIEDYLPASGTSPLRVEETLQWR